MPKWIRASAVQELAEANVPGFGRLVQERVEESLPELRTHLAELEAIVEAQR